MYGLSNLNDTQHRLAQELGIPYSLARCNIERYRSRVGGLVDISDVLAWFRVSFSTLLARRRVGVYIDMINTQRDADIPMVMYQTTLLTGTEGCATHRVIFCSRQQFTDLRPAYDGVTCIHHEAMATIFRYKQTDDTNPVYSYFIEGGITPEKEAWVLHNIVVNQCSEFGIDADKVFKWYGEPGNLTFEDNFTLDFNIEELRAERAAREEQERLEKMEKAFDALAKAKIDAKVYDEDINNIKARIENYMAQIGSLYHDLDILFKKQLLAEHVECEFAALSEVLKNQKESGILKAMDTFLYSDGTLDKVVLDYEMDITYWEEDEVRAIIKYVDSNYGGIYTKMAKALWEQGKYKFHFYQRVYLTCSGDVGRVSDSHLPKNINPHIGQYDCFGNNSSAVYTFMQNKQYDLAVTMLMNALCQINLSDYTVVKRLLENIEGRYTDVKCIRKVETGELITARQFLEEIKDM